MSRRIETMVLVLAASLAAASVRGQDVQVVDDFEGDLPDDEPEGDWDDNDEDVPTGSDEEDDQPEEQSTGQVFLGSGQRPWDRDQSDD